MDTPPVPPPPPANPPPPASPPPPANPPPPAKKSHTLLIVLSIVGVLVLLLIGGCVLLVRSCVRKVKEVTQEAQQNPQLAALSAAAMVAPDLEIVSKDVDKGIITIRNKKTGETVTIDTTKLSDPEFQRQIEQLSQGLKRTLGSAVTTAAATAPATSNAPEAPAASTTPAAPTAAKTPTVSAARQARAAAVIARFPAWVLRVEDGQPSGASTSQSGNTLTGRYTFSKAGELTEFGDATEQKLKADAFEVTRNNSSDAHADQVTFIVTRAKGKETMRIELRQSEGGPIEGTVYFTAKSTP